jgi:CheY-like chemotaxis protein
VPYIVGAKLPLRESVTATNLPPTLLGTVELVEDGADIGRLVEHHLQKTGFATRWFRTATNVIREAENHPPVLFILDLMLPGIDGFELCQSMPKHELLRGLPIIILTEPRRRIADSQYKLAQTTALRNPSSPADLIMRVRAVPRWFCVRCEFLKRSPAPTDVSLLRLLPFFDLRNNFGEHSLAEPVEGR